jgi:hypothetical protein
MLQKNSEGAYRKKKNAGQLIVNRRWNEDTTKGVRNFYFIPP